MIKWRPAVILQVSSLLKDNLTNLVKPSIHLRHMFNLVWSEAVDLLVWKSDINSKVTSSFTPNFTLPQTCFTHFVNTNYLPDSRTLLMEIIYLIFFINETLVMNGFRHLNNVSWIISATTLASTLIN